jgi:hypothetical protein
MEVIANPIDPKVMELLRLLWRSILDAGGRPEVVVVGELDHERYLKRATEVLGLRVEVREWAPDDRVLVLSNDDLRKYDDDPGFRGIAMALRKRAKIAE